MNRCICGVPDWTSVSTTSFECVDFQETRVGPSNLIYMKTMIPDQQLILSLIKDDLINFQLVHGLNALGLHADKYTLHLSETIFRLIGFEDNERSEDVYAHYLQLTKKAYFVDITESNEKLNDLALEIYLFLKAWHG